jgi:hypothetical protein
MQMGMFKDMRDLSKTGKQMKKERGGSFKMMKDGLAQANPSGAAGPSRPGAR